MPCTLTLVNCTALPQVGVRQNRLEIVSLRQAVAASADYIVVGRPITRAADPAAAAQAVVREIAGA